MLVNIKDLTPFVCPENIQMLKDDFALLRRYYSDKTPIIALAEAELWGEGK